MTTYAPVPAFAEGKRHPRALILILAGHAAALALVMTAKMDLPVRWDPTETKVIFIPEKHPPVDPPPPDPKEPRAEHVTQIPSIVPVPQPQEPEIVPLPTPDPVPLPNPGAGLGNGIGKVPVHDPVRTGPRFKTPESMVRPPYPQQKLRMEEEAVLRLRLSIDERGRVTAVEPTAAADPVFLAAARRHLIAHWRYTPATVDGRPVASVTDITLRFELD